MSQITILVIDDDEVDFASIKRTLFKHEDLIEKKINEIIHCSKSTESIEYIRKHLPDIILCDYNMPLYNGLDLLKEVKSKEEFESIPFLVLTGINDSNVLLKCLEAGAMDFIEKNADPISIVARIKSAIRYYSARKETDLLLQNILPKDAIIELKKDQKVSPKHYLDCAVLFSDFVDFSKISALHEPATIVSILNFYFSNFDRICEKWNVDKIKTIGDAYMIVGGLNRANENYTANTIHAAIEMMQFTNSHVAPGALSKWRCRIGISSGEIIAGVIGEKKFAYDVWGATVNEASRMETASRPEKIKISSQAHELVKNCHEFDFERIEIRHYKGIGDMETWYVIY